MYLRPLSTSSLILSLVCSICAVSACGDRLINPNLNGPSKSNRCKQQPEQLIKVQAGVQAGFKHGLIDIEGKAAYDQLIEVKNKFDTLQADYAQMSYQLCEDSAAGAVSQQYYERRRECLDQGLLAMRAMEEVFKSKVNASPKAASETDRNHGQREVTWQLESKLSWLREVLSCPQKNSNMTLPQPSKSPSASITLTTYLVCQKKVGQTFVDVPECTQTPLGEGDRVKIGFKANRDAHFYVFNYNNTGLFQMLFPDRGIPNQIYANRDYLIPVDQWLELDDQTNVTERLQVVASIQPIQRLETLRGTYVEPSSKSKRRQSELSLKTRGLLEPVLTRGFKQKGKKPIQLDVGGPSPVSTVPMITTKPSVNVIEFKLIHK